MATHPRARTATRAAVTVLALALPATTALTAVSAAIAFTAVTAAAQEVTLGGQLRPRFESRDPAFTNDGRSEAFTSMRTRLSVTAAFAEEVTAFVQIQDVRVFGEETSTLADFTADHLDIHQAWIQLGSDADDVISLRAGRQEVDLGGQRLVGAVDWTQQGRSFDGVRAGVGEAGARVNADLFAFQISESAAGRNVDAAFLGAYATVAAGPGRSLELYALHDRAERRGDAETEQTTAGARFVGASGRVDWRAEGAWQLGERAGADVGAWFFGARAGTALADGRARVTLWYDHLSGNDPDDDEVGVFSTLYATNHKFYGFADLFLDIPLHTAGRGLRDLAVKTTWTPGEDWGVGLDLHHFRVAQDAGLDSGHLADEIDATVGYLITPGVRMTGGLSYVREGDALALVRGLDEDMVFGYVMLDVVF